MNAACCSTLNDRYFEGFITFFYSLKKHNPEFNLPYYILNWGELSDVNISILKNIYGNFVFKDINNSDYEGCKYSTRWRVWNINCINRFDIFTLVEYDKLFFFDADMIVLGSLDDLFSTDVDFGACEIAKGTEIDHPSKFNKALKSFDGGLMVVGKKYINNDTKQRLIKIALERNWTSDEPILNVFFDNNKTTFLSKSFNTLTSEITKDNLPDVKILQYIGTKKPWYKGELADRYDEFVINRIGNLSTNITIDILFKRYYNEAKEYYGL